MIWIFILSPNSEIEEKIIKFACFLPYKSFLYLCGVRADNVSEKKDCSTRHETDIRAVIRHIKEFWKKKKERNIGLLYLMKNLRMAKCQIERYRERRNLNGDN